MHIDTPDSATEAGPAGRFLQRASEWLACIGGAVLVYLVAMSVVSIVGRKVAAMPVRGDVEMLEMGGAVAIACLLAYCEATGGNVRVEFFTDRLPARWRSALDAVGALLLALFAAVIAWRAGVKAIDTAETGETSALLHIPVAWAQWLIVPGFVLLCLVALNRSARFLHAALARPAGDPR